MGETRRLAALLSAGVVGYSCLAGLTVARCGTALRTGLIDPTIADNTGAT
jgi:hypothetical protein